MTTTTITNDIDVDQDFLSSEPQLYRYLKLIFFIVLLVPCVCLNIYLIFKYFRSSSIRSRPQNQSILFLIIVSFLDTTVELPITLQYLGSGVVKPSRGNFCLFWIWLNFSLQSMNLSLMLWTSIQRHLLIFHSHFFQTKSGVIRWHYIPFLLSSIYIPSFYFSTIFIYQCENQFDYGSYLCGTICYNSVLWLSTYDWVAHMLVPSMLIPFFTLILLVRVINQMKKMRRTAKWRSIRKLTLQLIIISSLYLLFWFPLALVSLIRIYFYPDFLTDLTFYYFYYTPYLVQLLIPLFSFLSLPEVWPKSNRTGPTEIQTLRNDLN